MPGPFTRNVYASKPKPREKYGRTYTLPELVSRLRTAEGQTHRAPTKAQKEAGNYAKGLFRFRGLEVSIENPAGSRRSGTDRDGKTWTNVMPYAYGYLRRTLARDGDQVDVFLGPDLDSDAVFGVDQVDPRTGRYDETKWFIGWKSKDAAKAAYLASYSSNWQGFLAITAMTFEQFKRWLANGDQTTPIHGQVTEKYARPWTEIKKEHLERHPEEANHGPNAWNDEDEKKHPRDHGKFATKPGAGAKDEKDNKDSKDPSLSSLKSLRSFPKLSIGGRAFEVLKQGANWLFRLGKKAPWSKATPAAAAAIEKKVSGQSLKARHFQARYGDVPVFRRAHRRAQGFVARIVQEILRHMEAQAGAPDPAAAAQEKHLRGKLNRHYAQLLKQTEAAYRRARQERDTTGRILRIPKSMEEVKDPETGELLPRHEVESRQKQARAKAREELRSQRSAWKEQGAAAWKQQIADWQAKREEREKRISENKTRRAAETERRRTEEAERRAKREKEEAKRLPKSIADIGAREVMRRFGGQVTAHIKEKTPEEKAKADAEKKERKKATWESTRKAKAAEVDEAKARLPAIAAESGVDPKHLREAAEHLAETTGTEAREYNAGINHAVARTGLRPELLDKWEDQGGDYSTFPGFDSIADQIASDYPALGMGVRAGESTSEDQREKLWEILRKGKRPEPQWYDEKILRDAAAGMGSGAGSTEQGGREPGDDGGEGELVGAAAGGDADWEAPWEKFSRRAHDEYFRRGGLQAGLRDWRERTGLGGEA